METVVTPTTLITVKDVWTNFTFSHSKILVPDKTTITDQFQVNLTSTNFHFAGDAEGNPVQGAVSSPLLWEPPVQTPSDKLEEALKAAKLEDGTTTVWDFLISTFTTLTTPSV